MTEKSPWHDALKLAASGSRNGVAAIVDEALAASAVSSKYETIAARIFLLAADFPKAVAAWERARQKAQTDEDTREVNIVRALVSGMLGDFATSLDTYHQVVNEGSDIATILAAIEVAVRAEAWEKIQRWQPILEKHASAKLEHNLRLADQLRLAGRVDDARALILRAVAASTDPKVARPAAAQLLIVCGAYDEARQLFEAQISAGVACASSHAGMSTLQLWHGDVGTALQAAANACRINPELKTTRKVEAIGKLLDGEHAAAIEALDSLVNSGEANDAETHAWRAEALVRQGKHDLAMAAARNAGDLSPDHATFIAVRVIEALTAVRSGRRPTGDGTLVRAVEVLCGARDASLLRKTMRRVAAGPWMGPDRVLAAGTRWLRRIGIPVAEIATPAEVESILERSLEAMGGNRSPFHPTRVEGGKLKPLRVEAPPRTLVRDAQHAVRFGGYETARRRLDLLIERYPGWPQPWYYRAEILMWLGRYDEAREDLEIALSRKHSDPEIEHGYWHHIGLAGVHLMQGRPEIALRTIDRVRRRMIGSPAQPYYAWRGEILRALGRSEEARDALQEVCPPGGRRLGSWLTLAMVCHDLGETQRTRQILVQAAESAPSLMLDLARSPQVARSLNRLQGQSGCDTLSDREVLELLARMTKALRGNRSASCVTFVDSDGSLRAIPPNGFYENVARHIEIDGIRAKL